jgi:hypothetical protein
MCPNVSHRCNPVKALPGSFAYSIQYIPVEAAVLDGKYPPAINAFVAGEPL